MGYPLRASLAALMLTVLSGCSDDSITGSYLSKSATHVGLLQLTQSSDGHFIGTLSEVSLKASGAIKTDKTGVKGVVDSGHVSLTLLMAGLPMAGNLEGEVIGDAIELSVMETSGKLAMQRFVRGSLNDFNQASSVLLDSGRRLEAKHQRDAKIKQLDDQVMSIARRMEVYVKRARKQMDDSPRHKAWFTKANAEVAGNLEAAKRLSQGNYTQIGEAQRLLNEIFSISSTYRDNSDTIDSDVQEIIKEQHALSAQLATLNGKCLGNVVAPTDESVMPHAASCRAVWNVLADYEAIKEPLQLAHASLAEHRDQAISSMRQSWKSAVSLEKTLY